MPARTDAVPRVRLAIAAAHVVLRESYRAAGHSVESVGRPEEILPHVDWDATLAIRRRLDSHGCAIAEAMDTAQRFAIGWPVAERLVRETGRLGLENGFVAGAGADGIATDAPRAALVDTVVRQAAVISEAGGVPILLPLPQLSLARADERAYLDVYGAIVRQVEAPVFVHFLGEAFHPDLRGYFPGESFRRVLEIDPSKVRGAKISLLDAALEVEIRRECRTREQVVLTGDDWHFASLVEGFGPPDGETRIGQWHVALGDFSHALLGILDAISEPFSRAIAALAAGDGARYRDIALPCEALGAHLFEEPTRHYKSGLAFLAWLSGRRENFLLVNREDRARDAAHFRRAADLAIACGAVADVPLARERLAKLAAEITR